MHSCFVRQLNSIHGAPSPLEFSDLELLICDWDRIGEGMVDNDLAVVATAKSQTRNNVVERRNFTDPFEEPRADSGSGLLVRRQVCLKEVQAYWQWKCRIASLIVTNCGQGPKKRLDGSKVDHVRQVEQA